MIKTTGFRTRRVVGCRNWIQSDSGFYSHRGGFVIMQNPFICFFNRSVNSIFGSTKNPSRDCFIRLNKLKQCYPRL